MDQPLALGRGDACPGAASGALAAALARAQPRIARWLCCLAAAVAAGIAVVGIALAGAVLPLAMAGGAAPVGPRRLAAGLAAADWQHALAHRLGGFARGRAIAVVAAALGAGALASPAAVGLRFIGAFVAAAINGSVAAVCAAARAIAGRVGVGPSQRRHLGAPWPGGARRFAAPAGAGAAIGWRQSAAGVAGGWLQRHRPQLFEFRGLPR